MLTKTAPTRFHFLNKSILLTTIALLIVSAVRPLTATADDNVAVFDFIDATFIADNGLKTGSNLPSTLTVGDITLTFKKVSNMSPGYYAPGIACLYTKNTLTISSTDKPIKSIEFTAWSGDKTTKLPTATNFSTSPGGLTYGGTTCTWSGEASSVTFRNFATGSTRIGLQCIKVYTEEQTSTKSTPELKFSSESATATVNGSVDVTLNNIPDGATVTYASSATNIASISADGTITAKAPGLVTITATTSSTDSYLQGSAACNLTITPSATTTATIENLYTKVTGQEDIVEGGIYLIVYEAEGENASRAMGAYHNRNNRYCDTLTIANNQVTTAVNKKWAPYEVSLTAASNGKFHLQTSDGYYLKNGNISDYTNASLDRVATINSSNRVQSQWTVTYNSDETVTIENYAENVTKFKYPKYLKYNSSSAYFSAYSSNSDNAQSVSLYRRTGTVSILTQEGYATLYTDCAFAMPQGLKGTTITGLTDDGALDTQWEYLENDTVPAYTGVLLKGEYGKTYTYNFVNTSLENSENCLAGTLVTETPTGDAASNFYRLTYYNDNGTKTLGFYLWNAEGTPDTNTAGHAYLKLPKTTTSAVKGFALVGPEATAIHNVETSNAQSQAIYTLSGLRINAASTNALPAGVYIVGGKKVLVR